MTNYLLNYDLIRRKDYQPLFDELTRLRGVRVLLSTWYIPKPGLGDTATVRDHFKKFIEQDDHLFVVSINDWAEHNVRATPPR